MTASPFPSFSAAGPELPRFDAPLRLDLVAGWQANQLSVAGVLNEQCAGRLGMVLDRLSQLMRPTLVQLHRVRGADEAGLRPLLRSAALRQQCGLAGLRVVTASHPVLDVFATMGVICSADEDVAMWQCSGERVLPFRAS